MQIFHKQLMNKKEKLTAGLLTGVCISIILLLNLAFSSFFTTWENTVYDFLFKLRSNLPFQEQTSPYLSILAPDDQFLESREHEYLDPEQVMLFAKQCKEMGAKTIGLDFIFRYKNMNFTLDYEKEDNIYIPFYLKYNNYSVDKQSKKIPSSFFQELKIVTPGEFPFAKKISTSTDILYKKFKPGGHINLTPDRDGINRRVPLFYVYEGKYIPSFALSLIYDFLEIDPKTVELHGGKYLKLVNARMPGGLVKDIKIPVDNRARIIINYFGEWNDSFDLIQPHWLMDNNENFKYNDYVNQMSRNMLVLIGDASTTGNDITSSVFEPVYPGVGIVASIVNSILTEQFINNTSMPEYIITGIFLITLVILNAWFIPTKNFFLFMIGLITAYTLLCISIFLFAHKLPFFLLPQIFLWLSLLILTPYKQNREHKKLALGIMNKIDKIKTLPGVVDKNQPEPLVVVEASVEQSGENIFNNRCVEYSITKRERQIIKLNHEGLETGEIAYRLDISPRTVENHIANIYKKANIHNRIGLSKRFFYND